MTLQKLGRNDQVPPGKFRFTVPETGYRIENELTLSGLLDRVERHYKSNLIPLPENWQELVVDQLCRRLPPGWCYYSDGSQSNNIPSVMSFENIMKGVKTLANMAKMAIKKEELFVDQNEAEERAAICARCFYNQSAAFCMGCGGARVILDLVGEVKGGRTTTLDGSLQNCGVCGCRNDAIVHVKKNILLSEESEDITSSRPAWCWLKNEDLKQAASKLKI